MENQKQTPNSNYDSHWESPRGNGSGKVMAGMLLVAVGIIILLAKLNLLFLPYWVFSWEVLLIVIGLFLGFKHSFQKPGWIILVLIGSIFLADDLIDNFDMHIYFWPIILIGIGLWVMLKPRRDYPRRFRSKKTVATASVASEPSPLQNQNFSTGYAASNSASSEEVVDVTAILGGIKKTSYQKILKEARW
ncbi:hypothetical protein GCM10028895_31060 [Pontibacter rugosus]